MPWGFKPVYKVKTAHAEITATATHPVLVHDKSDGACKYVDVQDLKVGVHQLINPVRDSDAKCRIDRVYTEPYARLSKEQKTKYVVTEYKSKIDLVLEALDTVDQETTKHNKDKIWSFLLSGVALPLDLAKTICEKFDLDSSKLIVHNRGERNPERINLPKYVDEDFSRLFGFLIGDGCLNYNGRMAKLLFSAGEID